MAEHPPPLGEAQLEQALADLGSRLAYPPTPALVPAVRARLLAPPPRRRPFWAAVFGRRLAPALFALVLLAGGVLVLSPDARSTVADRLGLRGITLTHLAAVPTPTLAEVATNLRLGERLTLAEAQARVPYQILLPTLPELDAPDEVYLSGPTPGGQVALVYRAGPGLPWAANTGVGLLLTEFRGDLHPNAVGKGLGPQTELEAVTVNGAPGYWIEGQPHLFFYRDANGRVHEESLRLARNTLLWEQAGLTLRLESALGKTEALRIAASVR